MIFVTIILLIIIFALLAFMGYTTIEKKIENLDPTISSTTPTTPQISVQEAIQNVASLYNSSNMTVGNLNVTGNYTSQGDVQSQTMHVNDSIIVGNGIGATDGTFKGNLYFGNWLHGKMSSIIQSGSFQANIDGAYRNDGHQQVGDRYFGLGHVTFPKPFLNYPPSVRLATTGGDLFYKGYFLSVANVTTSGFDIMCKLQQDQGLGFITIDWIAHASTD